METGSTPVKTQNKHHNEQPLWLRITAAVVLFLVFGVMYAISYAFWGGMSQWGGEYNPNVTPPDVFYLLYIWGPILLVLLITPTILTLTRIRWLWKIIFWILSLILAVATWMIWFVVIEATSK